MNAFALGTKKPLTKKEQERQKQLKDEEEAAAAFRDFVDTFDAAPKAKVFVKGSVINPGTGG